MVDPAQNSTVISGKPFSAAQEQRTVWHGLRLSLARLRDTLRAEVWPDEDEAPLTLAKMQLAQANMRSGVRTMPILALFCAWLHLQWAPMGEVAIWLAISLVGIGVRIWGESWMPAHAKDAATVRRAAIAYMAHSTLFVTAWGLQGLMFWQSSDANNQLVITVILLTSAMSATLTASWAYAPVSQIVIYIGSISLLFAQEGTRTGQLMALLALLYANFVSAAIVHLHRTATRLLSLESEKDTLIADLRQANTAKSEFLANMSHELRTPLNAILGFSEIMKDEVIGPMENRTYKSYAGDIHSSGQHLLGLVNDILDLAKIEAGKLELKDDKFTVGALVSEGLRLFAIQAQQKQVRLLMDVDPAIVVRWDLRAAKQIAINLVSNALKYTPQGGAVTVRAGMRASGGCYITVQDSGPGIAEEDRAVVFESFGQGRHDVATDVKSTGLGLAIVKALVELHGGEIRLDSSPGQGAAFTIEVPPDRVRRIAARSAA